MKCLFFVFVVMFVWVNVDVGVVCVLVEVCYDFVVQVVDVWVMLLFGVDFLSLVDLVLYYCMCLWILLDGLVWIGEIMLVFV